MDLFTENNTSFACAYCAQELGTLNTVFENQILAEHECLKVFENVSVHYESRKIHGAENELEDSECSGLALSSNQPNVEEPSLKDSARPNLSSSDQRNNNQASSTSNTHTSELWIDNTVKLLINIYKENINKFDSPSFQKKKVWEIISFELKKFGYNKSGVKCDEKWRNLRKTYDKVRTEINKTGNSKVTWKFYEDFHEIYWKDPHFIPIATASSTGNCGERKPTDTNNFTTEKQKGTKNNNLSPGEKRQMKPLFTAAEVEIRKQKRHDEKMKLKREIFDWFKKNLKQQD